MMELACSYLLIYLTVSNFDFASDVPEASSGECTDWKKRKMLVRAEIA